MDKGKPPAWAFEVHPDRIKEFEEAVRQSIEHRKTMKKCDTSLIKRVVCIDNAGKKH